MSDVLKRIFLALAILLAFCVGNTYAATLFWDHVTTNTDGSPATDLESYILYYRSDTTQLWVSEMVIPITTNTLTLPLRKGTYTLRAINTAGIESENSNLLEVKTPSKVIITRVTR